MNCEQAQCLLVAYLDGEITPSERALIVAHLSGCTVCQQELNLLSTARSRVRSMLQRQAAHASPSAEAWNRLEARMMETAQSPSNVKRAAWLARKPSRTGVPLLSAARTVAPSVSRASNQLFGGVRMQKRWIVSGLAGAIVLSVLAMLIARNVTPVSAGEILDRAYQAQVQPVPTQGISHIRSEIFSNIQALPEDQGMDTIEDSYSDLQTGYFRLVTTDSKTGKVLDASAYDGKNTYSQDYKAERNQNEPLTIYRTPQNQVDLKPVAGNGVDEKAIFEQMRNDPHVVSVDKGTWEDGHPIYVLQSHQLVKAMINGQAANPDGSITMYFDASTYKQLGFRMTMEKDGKEILLASQKILADEVLPAGTNVTWDLSDVQGISIVDDPTRTHGDLLPEVVTPKEAAQSASAKNQTVYLLKNVPDGYSLEITAPPQQSADQPYIYIASYRTPENDYFVIQAATPADVDAMKANSIDETYTTASGLVISFAQDIVDPSTNKTYTQAIAEAPDGTAFMITSTLPRETVKAWAEELTPSNNK